MFISFELEKDNFLRAPSNNNFVVDQVHVSKWHVSAVTCVKFAGVIHINIEEFTLSVEAVDLVCIIVIETLEWEVFWWAVFHLVFHKLPSDFAFAYFPEEVIVSHGGIVVNINIE